METIKNTVKGISQKEGRYSLILDDNKWYSDFGECSVKKGDKVEIEYEKSGNFNNIKKITVVEEAKEEKTSNNADKERFKSMCISYAKDLAVAGKIEVQNIGSQAHVLMTVFESL